MPGTTITISGDSNDSKVLLSSENSTIIETDASLSHLELSMNLVETKTATLETKTATLETSMNSVETNTLDISGRTNILESNIYALGGASNLFDTLNSIRVQHIPKKFALFRYYTNKEQGLAEIGVINASNIKRALSSQLYQDLSNNASVGSANVDLTNDNLELVIDYVTAPSFPKKFEQLEVLNDDVEITLPVKYETGNFGYGLSSIFDSHAVEASTIQQNNEDITVFPKYCKPIGLNENIEQHYYRTIDDFSNGNISIPLSSYQTAAQTSGLDSSGNKKELVTYELELGIIIKKDAYKVSQGSGNDYIAGFTLVNEVSSRIGQLSIANDLQWFIGKNYPTFLPTGPYLYPSAFYDFDYSEINLAINGFQKQSTDMRLLKKKPAQIVEYMSNFTKLKTGTLICSGTPAGSGVLDNGRSKYLDFGEVSRISGTDLGILTNNYVASTYVPSVLNVTKNDLSFSLLNVSLNGIIKHCVKDLSSGKILELSNIDVTKLFDNDTLEQIDASLSSYSELSVQVINDNSYSLPVNMNKLQNVFIYKTDPSGVQQYENNFYSTSRNTLKMNNNDICSNTFVVDSSGSKNVSVFAGMAMILNNEGYIIESSDNVYNYSLGFTPCTLLYDNNSPKLSNQWTGYFQPEVNALGKEITLNMDPSVNLTLEVGDASLNNILIKKQDILDITAFISKFSELNVGDVVMVVSNNKIDVSGVNISELISVKDSNDNNLISYNLN